MSKIASIYVVVVNDDVGMYMKSLMEFPPRQSPENWSPGAVMEKLRRHQEALESGSGAGVK
jgi:hypothetical protein